MIGAQVLAKIIVFSMGYGMAKFGGAPPWGALIGGWALIAATTPWRCRGCGRG